MSGITIPPAALEAGAKELAMNCRCELVCDWRNYMDDARAAFVAMVENWPEMREGWTGVATTATPALILPIIENPDDKS